MKLESFVSNLILSAINQVVTSTGDYKATIKKLLKQVSIRFFNEYRYTQSSKEAITVIQAWWQSDSDRLELAINGVDNISIMINREDFIGRGGEMQITELSAIQFYFRSGHLLAPGFAQTLICDLHDQQQIDAKVHQYLYKHAKHVIPQIPDQLSLVPTLRQYLPRYEQFLTLPNHDRRKALEKVNRIKLYFTGLMDKRIDKISKADLLNWLDSYRRPLTQQEVDCSFDRFIRADSTIKGAITTLRSAIETASNDDNIPFVLNKALYCKELTIHVSNEVDTFYPLEQELEMLKNLLTRDRTKLEGMESSCLFYDYFTPLVLLCRLTGLRPKYALAIRLEDINFELGQITIMGKKQGKIKSRNAVKMDKTLASVLKEWLKHQVHTRGKKVWLFPSASNTDLHLTTYAKTARAFRKSLSFEHFDFRAIRRTFATNLYLDTGCILEVQAALHHQTIEMTQRYLNCVVDLKAVASKDATAKLSTQIDKHVPNLSSQSGGTITKDCHENPIAATFAKSAPSHNMTLVNTRTQRTPLAC